GDQCEKRNRREARPFRWARSVRTFDARIAGRRHGKNLGRRRFPVTTLGVPLMAQNEFVFAPLGGIGEIGMNLSIYGFGAAHRRQWIIIDCGVSFASEEHLPSV